MKICIASGYYPYIKGGAEYQSKIIALELVKLGFEVFFISIDNRNKKSVFIDDGIKVYHINFNLKLNKLVLYYEVFSIINKILKNEKPNYLYQRVLNSMSYHYARNSEKLGYKFSLHIADNYCLEFKELSFSRIIRQYFFKKIFREDFTLIVQTKLQKELLLSLGLNKGEQIYNMHKVNNIDVDCIARAKFFRNVKKIVWIGNARPVKQLELYLDLAKLFEENKEFEFHFFGEIYDDEYGRLLKNRVESSRNTYYHGVVDNEDINKFLYEEAFLTVNTSVSEGFSNVFIQSWINGVLVLSLNSNPDDIFENPQLGKCFDGKISNFKEYILSISNSSTNYTNYSYNAYMTSKDLFSIEKNLSKMVKLITK
ncbi:glycosyltransferase family 4 protein [Myroides sp. C15-4]|uniref:glycosyltransferase family 4 protein n=1 Tax=Myroides sp. C15-4 TaxID=3400532 RepID=UPI003D2F89A2